MHSRYILGDLAVNHAKSLFLIACAQMVSRNRCARELLALRLPTNGTRWYERSRRTLALRVKSAGDYCEILNTTPQP